MRSANALLLTDRLFAVRYSERVRTLLLTNCDVEPDSPPPKVKPAIEMARAIEAALEHSTIPVRIVWGASDDIFSQADADYLDHGIRRRHSGV